MINLNEKIHKLWDKLEKGFGYFVAGLVTGSLLMCLTAIHLSDKTISKMTTDLENCHARYEVCVNTKKALITWDKSLSNDLKTCVKLFKIARKEACRG